MPERIQLRRTKGWRKPKAAVVVARPGAWGNPFVVHEHGDRCGVDLYATAYTDHKPFPPIIVRKFGRTKKLVALDGNHRRTAAANAGHTTHPALIVECTDEAALTIMLEGNMANGLQLPKQQRIAQAVHLVEIGYTARDAARRLGVHEVEISTARTISRAGIRAAALNVTQFDQLPQGHRLDLARIASDPVFAETAKLIVATGMKGGPAAELVRKVKAARSDQVALELIGLELETQRDTIQRRHGVSTKTQFRKTEYGRAVTATMNIIGLDPEDVAASCPNQDAARRFQSQLRQAAQTLMDIAKKLD